MKRTKAFKTTTTPEELQACADEVNKTKKKYAAHYKRMSEAAIVSTEKLATVKSFIKRAKALL